MAPRPVQLSVSNPCQQQWQEMTADGQNRFCSHCQKTVVNFADMSDAEIQAYFTKQSEKVCGRFRVDQLIHKQPYQPTPSFTQRWLSLVAAGLVSWTTTQGQSTETPKPNGALLTVTTSNAASASQPTPTSAPIDTDSTKVITGRILANSDNSPVPVASVYFKGTTHGTSSNVDGTFNLTFLPDTPLKPVLVVKFIGYKTQEITIDPTRSQPLEIRLYDDTTMMGEVIVVGYVQKPSLFKRLRNRFRSSQ